MIFCNVPFSVASVWVVAVSMRIGFCFSDGSVHREHRVRTLNVYQPKPALSEGGVRTHRTQDMLEPGNASKAHLGHI